jgi:predicted MFS family arabinose efflux permease
MPLLAASLTDDPLLIASVTACGYLPWLLFGLLGGAVADRVDQRRVMWAVDLLRGALMAAFATAVWQDLGSMALLLTLAFTLTTLQTFFDNAATALLPSLVPTQALAGTPLGALLGGAAAARLGPNTPALPAAALFVPAVARRPG